MRNLLVANIDQIIMKLMIEVGAKQYEELRVQPDR
jgi:hypothetical protein